MSQDNPLWGTERIRGELPMLGVVVSNRSIRRYRWRRTASPPSQTWRTLLRNHAHAIWAADLCVVQTLTFKTLYVLLFITHGRRELVHLAVAAHPTAASVPCGLAVSREMLVAARFVQGAGGALASALILGMVVSLYPEPGAERDVTSPCQRGSSP